MAIIVTLPYDPTWQVLEWAKANCPGYITNAASETSKSLIGKYQYVADIDYYFSNEKDALLFKLKWA